MKFKFTVVLIMLPIFAFAQEEMKWNVDEFPNCYNCHIDIPVSVDNKTYTLSGSIILNKDKKCIGISVVLDKIFNPENGVFFRFANSVKENGKWTMKFADVPTFTYQILSEKPDYYILGFKNGIAVTETEEINLFDNMLIHRFLFMIVILNNGEHRTLAIPLGDVERAINSIKP